MAETLSKFENESNKTVSQEETLEYLDFSTFVEGNGIPLNYIALIIIYITDKWFHYLYI